MSIDLLVTPIGPPSKLYEDNQATIKIFLAKIITPQAIHIDAQIAAIHELHPRKNWDGRHMI